jgi:hypothetical protein
LGRFKTNAITVTFTILMPRKGAKIHEHFSIQAAGKPLSFAAYQPLIELDFKAIALRLRAFARQ